jgi:hypothetical protein
MAELAETCQTPSMVCPTYGVLAGGIERAAAGCRRRWKRTSKGKADALIRVGLRGSRIAAGVPWSTWVAAATPRRSSEAVTEAGFVSKVRTVGC